MKTWIILAVAALGWNTTTAFAQSTLIPRFFSRAAEPKPVIVQVPVIVQPSVASVQPIVPVSYQQGGYQQVMPETMASDAAGRRRPVRRALGCDCQGDFREFGCGSFHSEMTFMFGSCHTFFGDPCVQAPRHPWLSGMRKRDCDR